jgi:hypothetical protein
VESEVCDYKQPNIVDTSGTEELMLGRNVVTLQSLVILIHFVMKGSGGADGVV